MRTESVLLHNLCAPCACRCRYCLLSWDGRPVGVPWERGALFALRFRERISEERPDLRFNFSFGYAMESPAMRDTLRFIRQANQQGKQSVIGYISDQVPLWQNIHHWLTFFNQDTPVFTGVERIARKYNQAIQLFGKNQMDASTLEFMRAMEWLSTLEVDKLKNHV